MTNIEYYSLWDQKTKLLKTLIRLFCSIWDKKYRCFALRWEASPVTFSRIGLHVIYHLLLHILQSCRFMPPSFAILMSLPMTSFNFHVLREEFACPISHTLLLVSFLSTKAITSFPTMIIQWYLCYDKGILIGSGQSLCPIFSEDRVWFLSLFYRLWKHAQEPITHQFSRYCFSVHF